MEVIFTQLAVRSPSEVFISYALNKIYNLDQPRYANLQITTHSIALF
jgi:hypothetical protein